MVRSRCQKRRWVAAAAAAVVAIATVCTAESDPIDRRIDKLSPEERIGQMLIVSCNGSHVDRDLRRMVQQWKVGGIVLYRTNIPTRTQTQQLISDVRRLEADLPLFVAIDQEGGSVDRLRAPAVTAPSAMALGATRSAELAYRAGLATARSLRRLGFSMNFAPVLDLDWNRESAIGTRSFGTDPTVVAELGSAFARGEADGGIIAVAKHFVGEGSASGDTHRQQISVDPSADIEHRDLAVFRTVIQRGIPAVMTSHVIAPQVSGDAVPVTLSPTAINELLRGRLQFEGVVITDAMEMVGLTNSHDLGESAVLAVEAGADVVLTSGGMRDHQKVRDALLHAYRARRLSEPRIRESLRRILALKLAPRARELAFTSDPSLVTEVAGRAITALECNGSIATLWNNIPVSRRLYVGDDGPIAQKVAWKEALIFGSDRDRDGLPEVKRASANIGLVVAAFRNRDEAQAVADFRRRVWADARLIVVALGDPHDFEVIADADAYIAAYGSGSPDQNAVIAVLTGRSNALGILPVAANLENRCAVDSRTTRATTTRGPHGHSLIP